MFRRLLPTLACSSLLIITACQGAVATPTPTPRPPLRFAYDLWPGYYPVFIAQDQGYFAEAQLNIETIKPENTDETLGGFASGKYDFVAVSLGDIVNLTRTSPDLRFIIAADYSDGADVALVLPDSGIAAVTDLKGKRIGTNLGGFGEFFITTVLEQNGLASNDVTWVNVDASNAPAALQTGQVDLAHTWEPYVTEAKNQGAVPLFSSHDAAGLVLDGIAVRGAVARERPEEVRAFVQAWFKAVAYWQANPTEGAAAIGRQLNIDPATISLDGIKLLTLAENQALFQPGSTSDSAYFTAQKYIDFFIASGTLTTAPDVNQMLDPQFVAAATLTNP